MFACIAEIRPTSVADTRAQQLFNQPVNLSGYAVFGQGLSDLAAGGD